MNYATLPDDHGVPAGAAVYFLQCTDTLRIKIGFSTDTKRRVEDINKAASTRVVLLCAVPGTADDERELHQRFRDSRVNHIQSREWFLATPDLVRHIEALGGTVGTEPEDAEMLGLSLVAPYRARLEADADRALERQRADLKKREAAARELEDLVADLREFAGLGERKRYHHRETKLSPTFLADVKDLRRWLVDNRHRGAS